MSTELSKILEIADEQPLDFYKNSSAYIAKLDSAIGIAESLVYPLDDDGRKQAKNDVALIRKYSKLNKFWALNVFRSVTEKYKSWQDEIYGKSSKLDAAGESIINRFEKMEAEKLKIITEMMQELLDKYRLDNCVKPEFHGKDKLVNVAKLSGFMTEGGKLTTKATNIVKALYTNEIAEQNRIESRLLMLENACLKAEITPLQKEHFGSVFYAEESLFQEKLQELINVELSRKAEMEARIKRQQEAENKRILDAKLAEQQAEANRIAKEELAKQAPPVEQKTVNNYSVESENIVAKRQEERDDKKNFVQTVVQPTVANGRRLVLFDVRFEMSVPAEKNDDFIENWIIKQLSDSAKKYFKEVNFYEASFK